jgi:hypothetical protein
MIIYFLQTRNPPVLPALHQRPHMKLPAKDGCESAFADDLNALKGYGKGNKETIGELLFHFFRFYGHEFDYDKHVVSVRNGKHLSKVEKKWHLANNNTLCVEEPFNVGRNLGNTADDTSFRGLHLEIRRAFDLVSQAKLNECCEQFEFPKEEERVWERPPPKPRPVLRSTSQSNRGGRNGNRGGGRHNNSHPRNGNSNRRASSAGFDNKAPYAPGAALGPNMTPQDIWLQQQAQAQLHNDLYATYSVLQAQENSLRLQLYNQSQGYMQARQNHAFAQSQSGQGSSGSTKQQPSDRNRTSSFDQPPLTAPIRPDMYYYPVGQYPGSPMFGYQTPSTNPSSPSLSSAVPELRRSVHRSSAVNGGQNVHSNSSLRSHSQPAARSASAQMALQGAAIPTQGLGIYHPARQPNGLPIPNFIADENAEPTVDTSVAIPSTTPPEYHAPKEYVGYYVNNSRQMQPPRRESVLSIPAFGDLGHSGRRRLSTDQLPQSVLDRLKRPSRSPSPLGHDRSYSTGAPSAPFPGAQTVHGISSSNLRALNTQAPIVVNGSNVPTPVSIPNWQASINGGGLGDYRVSDIAVGSLDSASQASETTAESERGLPGQLTPRDVRVEERTEMPLVVNGSTPQVHQSLPVVNGSPSVGIVATPPNAISISDPFATPTQRLSPNSRIRLSRQNGGMSPLDIGIHHDNLRDDLPHLSPVYETRTPSPSASRKLENGVNSKAGRAPPKNMDDLEALGKQIPKSLLANGHSAKQNSGSQKLNGHTRASKSEGGSSGTWQKIPKGKKKGATTEMKTVMNGQPQSEKLPSNESERKGG